MKSYFRNMLKTLVPRSLARNLFVWLLLNFLVVITLGCAVFIALEVRQIQRGVGNAYKEMSRIIADSFEKYIRREYVESNSICEAAPVIQAIIENNRRSAAYSPAELLIEAGRLDNEWMHTIGFTGILEQVLEHPASRYLQQFQRKKADIVREVLVTDEKGWLVAASGKTSDFYQADEPWWQKAFSYGKGDEYFSNIEYDTSARSWGITIARPMFAGGKVIGVLKLVLDQSSINKFIEKIVPARQGQITVIDSDGKVLFDSFLLPGTLDKKMDREIVHTIDGRRAGGYIIAPNLLGVQSIIGFSPVYLGTRESDEFRWYLLYMQTLQAAVAPFLVRVPILLVLFALFITILAAGSFIIARLATRPLQRLVAEAEAVSRNDYRSLIQPQKDDETRRLAETINDIIRTLHNRDDQLTHRAVEISALGDICKIVALDKNFEQVVERILGIIVENKNIKMDSVACSLYTHQPSDGRLFKRAHAGFLHAAPELDLSVIPEEYLSYLIDRKQTLFVTNLRQSDGIFHVFAQLYGSTTISSTYIYPVISRSGVLGLLIIASASQLHLSGDENTVLRIICDQISQGLENEKLFKDMFEKHWEMYWLHEAALVVSFQHDFNTVVAGMAKIMMASCKAEKIIFIPADNDLGIQPPGQAFGFYGDSGIIVEHDVIQLMHEYCAQRAVTAGHELIDFDDPALKNAPSWKQFRKHVSTGLIIQVREPDTQSAIGNFCVFSDRQNAFSKDRLLKLLLTYTKYISDIYPTIKKLAR